MRVEVFTGDGFAENAYLAVCEQTRSAVAIDPGAATPRLVAVVRELSVSLEAILLTHAHLDHIEGIARLRETSDAEIFLHPADRPLYDGVLAQAHAFGLRVTPPPPPERQLSDGDTFTFGACSLEVRHCPGHSPGHVILFARDAGLAFVGDVIFQGSIGRTDLPGGDFQRLMRSIRDQVLTLPDDTCLLSGHGPPTTVANERRFNPFLIPHYRGELA